MPYITPEGAQRFSEELKYLWKKERPEWTQRVSAAAAEGDRSENAEYIYGKKKLREIDRRIRYLTKVLDECKVVDSVPKEQSRVYFGAWVEIEDLEGVFECYRIVGPHESDLKERKISINSPVARQLMGKQAGDECEVMTPDASRVFVINKVWYEQ